MKLIEKVLKETALATTGVLHYGRGSKSFANIESKTYPRVWIHLVNPIDIVAQNNSVSSVYQVVGEITTKVDFTSDIANNEIEYEKYLDSLEDIEKIYIRFITNLNKRPENKTTIGQVKRDEILHEYDDNLIGYVFTFTMNIIEKREYQCL